MLGEERSVKSAPVMVNKELRSDWFGHAVAPPIWYQLGAEGKGVRFSIGRLGRTPERVLGEAGQFYEGLWEGEVGELFLKLPGEGHYLEVNLSPSGAFWMMAFDGVRQRAGVPPGAEGLETTARVDDGWHAEILLTERFLAAVGLDGASLRGDVCAIWQEEGVERFASTVAAREEAPDFHRPHAWRRLEVTGWPEGA